MSPRQPDALTRLRAANPALVDEDRGRTVAAQAALQRILTDATAPADVRPPGREPRRRRRRSPRGLALVLAAVLLGGGAAIAAADRLGWWSPNPGEAMYGANHALRVRTPNEQTISCRPALGGEFRCVSSHSGQQYSRIDAIQPPASLSRAELTAYIAQRLAAGTMTATEAATFRGDLAAVPDSFFPEYRLASRFGSYSGGGDLGNGRTRIPPAGVPEFLVCENAGAALSCQDLNGDHAAPIGAGVYMAEPSADWRPAPPSRRASTLPPGVTFTPAEYRLPST
jgi:hypothetical protein